MQRAADRSYHWFLQMWSADILWTYCHSCTYTAITMNLIRYSLSDGILSLNYTLTLSTHCQSPFLSIVQYFREGAWSSVQNHILSPGVSTRLRAGVGVGQIFPTPAPTPSPAKTVDSDRLQLRSRLRLRSPASKYPPKSFVTLCQMKVIKGEKVRKGQTQNLEFGVVRACFWVIFSSRTQKWP